MQRSPNSVALRGEELYINNNNEEIWAYNLITGLTETRIEYDAFSRCKPRSILVKGDKLYVLQCGERGDGRGDGRGRARSVPKSILSAWDRHLGHRWPKTDILSWESPTAWWRANAFFCFTDSNETCITSASGNMIMIYNNENGKWIKSFECQSPQGIVSYDNHLICCDSKNNKINLWNRNGKLLRSWGSGGNDDGELNVPIGLAFTLLGGSLHLIVVDSKNQRLQMFT